MKCRVCGSEKDAGCFYLASNGRPYKKCKDYRMYDRLRYDAGRVSNGVSGSAAAAKDLWRKRNRDKVSAQQKLRRAVKLGRVKKEVCAECGSIAVQAHHFDYSRPLDVVWLCPKHHMRRHRKPRVSELKRMKSS